SQEDSAPDGRLPAQLKTSSESWLPYFERLANQRRAAVARDGGKQYWGAAERAAAFEQIFPNAHFDTRLPVVSEGAKTRDDAILDMATGRMLHVGPIAPRELASATGVSEGDFERAMLRLEASGAVLRGQFTGTSSQETEWCDRRLLARIHRLT